MVTKTKQRKQKLALVVAEEVAEITEVAEATEVAEQARDADIMRQARQVIVTMNEDALLKLVASDLKRREYNKSDTSRAAHKAYQKKRNQQIFADRRALMELKTTDPERYDLIMAKAHPVK